MTEQAAPRLFVKEIAHDISLSVRTLRREPALLAGVVLTLALALGVNAAMFGVVSRLLFSPPPGVHAPETLYHMKIALHTERGEQFEVATTSYPVFSALHEGKVFDALAAVRPLDSTVGRGETLSQVSAVAASGDYFRVLGAQPELGRFFGPADDQLPIGRDVVVLSHDFWRKHFAAAPSVLGTELIVNDRPFTIIGVAPPRFTGDAIAPVDVFLPLTAAQKNDQSGWITNSRMNVVTMVARVTGAPTAVEQRATRTVAQLDAESPNGMERAVRLESLIPGEATRSTPRGRIALWLSGVTIIVLLTAAANVGTLLLLRAARRRRDLSVRLALGIGRARLLRQLMLESLVLATTGGTAGVLLSRWISELLRHILFQDLAPAETFVDSRVLLLTAIASFSVGILAALSPMLMVSRLDISQGLQTAGGRLSAGKSSARVLLVSAQVGLSTVLLVGAGLFVRSLDRVKHQDLGFNTAHLVYIDLDFTRPLLGPDRDRAYLAARDQVLRVHGVAKASEVQAMPFGNFHVPPMSVPGRSEPPNVNGQLPFLYAATPAFLEMMGVQLRAGRLLNAGDNRTAPYVVLVNETMAREVWPGENALGKCIRAGHDPTLPPAGPMAASTLPCREVVGIVRDSRARSIRPVNRETSLMQVYVPFEQVPVPPFPGIPQVNGLLVQTSGDPRDLLGDLQHAIQRNTEVPVFARVRPYQDLLNGQLRPWLLGASLFSAFGALALAIAAVGLFAVIAYVANEQTKAIGIRLALGAEPASVRTFVVTGALKLIAGGLVAGVIAALLLGRYAQDLLFETSARDALVVTGAAGALLVVTIIASLLPAIRAGRVNPLIAFRTE